MRRGIGVACVIVGLICLLGAVGLVSYNRLEAYEANQISQAMLQDVKVRIEKCEQVDDREDNTMKADASGCIGILSIPVLELELPVLTEWSDAKLKKAPCHYYGSCYEENFVIMAHNYRTHFGRLSELIEKDLVLFTDITGKVHCYEVVLLETLPEMATEEMLTSGFDLSLYTCTPSGSNRITVRCKAVEVGR